MLHREIKSTKFSILQREKKKFPIDTTNRSVQKWHQIKIPAPNTDRPWQIWKADVECTLYIVHGRKRVCIHLNTKCYSISLIKDASFLGNGWYGRAVLFHSVGVALILITFTLLRCIISNHKYQQHGKARSTQVELDKWCALASMFARFH